MIKFPRIIWLLGFAGVIPFLVLFLYLFNNNYSDNAIFLDKSLSVPLWLGIYAAIILSFLGAVSWGVAMALHYQLTTRQMHQLLVYGVLPSIFAWFSLLLPIQIALYVMAGLIVLTFLADLKMLSPLLSPQYLRLRLYLTILVSVLLTLSAWVVSGYQLS